jgi:hypothetical protein
MLVLCFIAEILQLLETEKLMDKFAKSCGRIPQTHMVLKLAEEDLQRTERKPSSVRRLWLHVATY